jgi:hypothetical protein
MTTTTDKTGAERQARKRLRDKVEKGLVAVLVKVHETRREEIKALAVTMREPVAIAQKPALPYEEDEE